MIKYRSLHGYKYQLLRHYSLYIDITGPSKYSRYITLGENGHLIIHDGYAWDGPSGPTFDTETFMRGSLVHDALYQLIRDGYLDMNYRAYADKLLFHICVEDGMWKARALWVYVAVRLFGRRAAGGG